MPKKRHRPPVTLAPGLPPLDWQTSARPPGGGKPVPLARAPLTEAFLFTYGELGKNGDVIVRRERVWRTAEPPTFANLTPAGRDGFRSYAAAVEAVGASTGTLDPSGGGGGGRTGHSPSVSKLMAAERLRRAHAALDGGELVIARVQPGRAGRETIVAARMTLRDVAHLAAVEGATRTRILHRAGIAPGDVTDAMMGRCTIAVADAATRLAICFGHMSAPDAGGRRGNSTGQRV